MTRGCSEAERAPMRGQTLEQRRGRGHCRGRGWVRLCVLKIPGPCSSYSAQKVAAKEISLSTIYSQWHHDSLELHPAVARLSVLQVRVLKVPELTPLPSLFPLESVNPAIEGAVGEVVVDGGLQWEYKLSFLLTLIFTFRNSQGIIKKKWLNDQFYGWIVSTLINVKVNNCIIYFYSITGIQTIMLKWWFQSSKQETTK